MIEKDTAAEEKDRLIHFHFKNICCISEADLVIEPQKLNVFYGPNGIGKSSMIKGLGAYFHNNVATDSTLKPFLTEFTPEVTASDDSIKSVLIYNQDYINQYLFQKNDALNNTYNLFYKPFETDEKIQEINNLLSNVKEAAQKPNISRFQSRIQPVFDTFGITQEKENDKFSFETHHKGCQALSKQVSLTIPLTEKTKQYKPYSNETDWIDWLQKGSSFVEQSKSNICPYCGQEMKADTFALVASICKNLKSKKLKDNLEARKSLNEMVSFLSKEKRDEINSKILSSHDAFSVHKEEITKSIQPVASAYDKICKIIDLSPYSLQKFFEKDKHLETILDSLKIDESFLTDESLSSLKEEIEEVNKALDQLKEKVTKLEENIGKIYSNLTKKIKEDEEQINEFLVVAGIPYEVSVENISEKEAQTRLIYKRGKDTLPIADASHTLSYGEYNAICLAFFAVEASRIGENSLIILDDPISSYDDNKRLAIMLSLFASKRGFSLRNRTVCLFTHDFNIVINILKRGIRELESISSTKYIKNDKGIIRIGRIDKSQVEKTSTVEKKKAMCETSPILVRLVHARRYYEIIEGQQDTYQYLSSVLHGYDCPNYDGDSTKPIDQGKAKNIEKKLCELGITGNYDSLLAEVQNKQDIIKQYDKCTSNYNKLCLARALIENNKPVNNTETKLTERYIKSTYHIEQEQLFEYTEDDGDFIPRYIVDICDDIVHQIIQRNSQA